MPGKPRMKATKSTRAVAMKALRLAKKNASAQESKIHDVQVTGGSIGTTPSLVSLSSVSEGSGISNRTGVQTLPTGLHFKYLIFGVAASTNSAVRVMVGRWDDSGLPTIGDILQDTSATDNIVSPKNRDERHKSKILYDKVHIIDDSKTNLVGAEKFIKLNYGKTVYDEGASTHTNGALFLATMSSDNTNSPQITYFSRLYFKE